MNMTKLPISEQFYSIQGEGTYAGTPSVFLRLQGCNLCCGGWENKDVEKQEDMKPKGEATWVCDTIATWRKEEEYPTVESLVDEWVEKGWLENFRNGTHLILTGGEPTMPSRQHQLVDLLWELNDHDALPFVEVETNGTIAPLQQFDVLVDHYNISMKLSNSGMSESRRITPDAINHYKARWSEVGGAMFKFVVSREEDVQEILELVEGYDIPDGMISLMPAGASQEQLRETYPLVAELCKKYNWDFSPRLHIDAWDMQVGV